MFILIILLVTAIKGENIYEPNSPVIELTAKNFENLVYNSPEVWIVEFYADWCTHSREFVKDYEKIAHVLQGIVKVGAVDEEVEDKLRKKFDVAEYPTLLIFSGNKRQPFEYEGDMNVIDIVDEVAFRLRERIGNFLEDVGVSSRNPWTKGTSENLELLTDRNFDRLVADSGLCWAVMFVEEGCKKCKEIAPKWAGAAKKSMGKVKFGTMDASVHKTKLKELSVEKFPTIKFLVLWKQVQIDFEGNVTMEGLSDWAEKLWLEHSMAPEILEIVDSEAFEEECSVKLTCVISFLPKLEDCNDDCRYKYIEILGILASARKLWGWVWAEGGAQLRLEKVLDIPESGYPSVIVMTPQEMNFGTYKGPFTVKGIDSFLRDFEKEETETVSVKGGLFPKIVEVEEPWEHPYHEHIQYDDYNMLRDEL